MQRTRKPPAGRSPGPILRPVAALIAGAMMAMTPLSAMAEAGDGSRPVTQVLNDGFLTGFDVAVLRPLGIGRMVIGGAILVPMSIINAIGLPFGRDTNVFKDDVDRFVVEPAQYTFTRPVGVDLAGG